MAIIILPGSYSPVIATETTASIDDLLLIIAVTITVVLLLTFVYFIINEITMHNKWDRTPLHQSRQCTDSGVGDELSKDATTTSQCRDVDCRSCGDPLTRTYAMFQGAKSMADKNCNLHCEHYYHTITKSQEPSLQNDNHGPSFQETPHTNYNQFSSLKVTHPPGKIIRNKSSLAYTIKQKDLEVSQKQVQRKLEARNSSNEHLILNQIVGNKPVKPPQPSNLQEPRLFTGYSKATYAVLIGDTVRVCNTKIYTSLPHSNKFLNKERHWDLNGITSVKLTLKSADNKRYIAMYVSYQPLFCENHTD